MPYEIRRLPEQPTRVETGPVKFGNDHAGLFIRGDNAFGFWLSLNAMLDNESDKLDENTLTRLSDLLNACDERNEHVVTITDTCQWRYIPEHSYDPTWATGCGEQVGLFSGGPHDNGIYFCNRCGKQVEAINADAESDTENDIGDTRNDTS